MLKSRNNKDQDPFLRFIAANMIKLLFNTCKLWILKGTAVGLGLKQEGICCHFIYKLWCLVDSKHWFCYFMVVSWY